MRIRLSSPSHFVGLIALLCIVPMIVSAQPIIKLKQWKIENGGNDHWYGIFASTHPWVVHRDTAHTLLLDTFPGYLASITSASEDQFIRDSIVFGVQTDNIANEFYLGADFQGSDFQWLTGEQFAYANWNSGEPNGDGGTNPGRAIAMWGLAGQLFGFWNDVPKDTAGVGPIHRLWSVIEWNGGAGPIDTNPASPFLSLKQWRSEIGGNDHWYGVFPLTKPWVAHRDTVPTFIIDSMPGYLATITRGSENAFIRDSIVGIQQTNNVSNQFYLGLAFDSGQWQWLTGETFQYSNWGNSEPSFDVPNTVGAISGVFSGFVPGTWNDVPRDTVGLGTIHQLWAVVEWGPNDTTIDSVSLTPLMNLKQWSFRQGGNDHWYAIIPKTMPWVSHNALADYYTVSSFLEAKSGYLATTTTVPENNFIRDSIVSGVQTDNISNQFYLGLTYDSGQWAWGSAEPFVYTNWGGGQPSFEVSDPAATISGTSAPFAPGQWNDVPRDTIGHGPVHQLWSVVEFDGSCCIGNVGNVDGDPGDQSDIADLTRLVGWLFLGDQTPICKAEADHDGNRSIDIADLTLLIEYLFITFAPPPGCYY